MRLLIFLTIALFAAQNLFGQDPKVAELIAQGIELHDQARYVEAIEKYKAAIKLDVNSSLANYEMALTYFVMKEYKNAIKYSTVVTNQNTEHQHAAYIIWGSALDLTGKPAKAIKVYEEGLLKHPQSNLLNYNLALTAYHQKDYDKGEHAAINAILARPDHASSHIILSAIMQDKGKRAQSLLSLYYALLLEPNSHRSGALFINLMKQLSQGVEKKDEMNINLFIPSSAVANDDFSAAEMMVSMLAAARYTETNKDKSDFELLPITTGGFFNVLGELKKDKKGFWWEFYVPVFNDLEKSDNCEAFCYYISQSTNSKQVVEWIANSDEKMQQLMAWIENL